MTDTGDDDDVASTQAASETKLFRVDNNDGMYGYPYFFWVQWNIQSLDFKESNRQTRTYLHTGGAVKITEVSKNDKGQFTRDMLESDDAYILDTGSKLFVW